MSRPLFTILYLERINGDRVNFFSFGERDVKMIINWIKGKDLDRIAIFKNYRHIQFPLIFLSEEDIERILIEA